MKSSCLLLKVFRRRIGICLLLESLVVFLVALDDIHRYRPESVLDSFRVAFLVAFALSLFLCFQTRCNTLPFPVSVRQRAWLPMLIFGLIWSVGGLAITIMLVIFCLGDPYSMMRMLSLMITRAPFYVLGFLFMARIWRARPYLIFIGPFFFLFADKLDAPGHQTLASTYALWWPVVLGAIAFYIYEAPIQLAQQDRLLVGGKDLFQSTPTLDQSVVCRRDLTTWIADSVEGAVLLAAIVGFFREVLPLRIPSSFPELLSLPSLLWTLAIGLWFAFLFRSQYQCSLASGFKPVPAFWVTLMQMTIVLIPLTQTLGVKKGTVAQCDQCRRSKFLWALICPHCGHAGPGVIANKELARAAQGRPAMPARRRRLFIRVLVPLQLFVMFGFFAGVGNRTFVTHTVFLNFNENQDRRADNEVITRIRELVESNPSLDNWQGLPAGNALASQVLPERFRLNVRLLSSGSIWVQGYSLRWDLAGALTGQLAQCLVTQLQDISQTSLGEQRQNYGRSPLFQTRTYLDNQIHWVEPRDQAR